jgi:hypothetical protein
MQTCSKEEEVTTKLANGGGGEVVMFQMREEEGDSVLANQVCKERCSCASGGLMRRLFSYS